MLTNCDNVAESTKVAEIELAPADLLPSAQQTDGNGSSICGRQANDADAGEGVEGGGRAKVDDSEDDLYHHAEHHGVERHVQSLVDLDPPLGAWDGTITSKSPSATRRGGGAANTAHDGEDHDGDEEANGTARRADGGLDDGRHGLGANKLGEGLQVVNDEDKRDEEQEAGNGVDDDGGNHGLGDLGGRVSDFFAHTDVDLLVSVTKKGSCQGSRQTSKALTK